MPKLKEGKHHTEETEIKARQVLHHISLGVPITAACKRVNISRSQMNRWLKEAKNEDLYYEAVKMRNFVVLDVEYDKAINDKDQRAIEYVLEKLTPKKFQQKIVNEYSGEIEVKHRIFDIQELAKQSNIEEEKEEENKED